MATKTRSELLDDIDEALPDNTAGEISPADVRDRLVDIVDSARLAEDGGGDGDDLMWLSKAIGEIIYLPDNLTGVDGPPTDNAGYRYVKLTAGLTGSGQYNNGCLTSESTSGSAPLVSSTGVVSLSGSPMNGQTVRLLNTEGRILRPSTSAGTAQNDQMQQITGETQTKITSATGSGGTGALRQVVSGSGDTGSPNGSNYRSDTKITFDSATSPNARAGDETRMKNLGVTAYMRIK